MVVWNTSWRFPCVFCYAQNQTYLKEASNILPKPIAMMQINSKVFPHNLASCDIKAQNSWESNNTGSKH